MRGTRVSLKRARRRAGRRTRRRRPHPAQLGRAQAGGTDKSDALVAKIRSVGVELLDEGIDAVADFVGVELTPDERQQIEQMAEKEAAPLERAALDAAGVIPGIGEAVEAARFVGDLVTTGENLMGEKDKMEQLVREIGGNADLHSALMQHHAFQGKLLDRVNESKKQFRSASAAVGAAHPSVAKGVQHLAAARHAPAPTAKK